MEAPDRVGGQKKAVIIMMLACIISGVIGLTSTYWTSDIDDPSGGPDRHSSLSAMYFEDPPVGTPEKYKFSEEAEFFCDPVIIEESPWVEEGCSGASSMRDAGRLATALLVIGILSGILFILVAHLSIDGDWNDISTANMDYRFGVTAAGSTTLAALLWRVISNEYLLEWSVNVGWSFYVTLFGGVVGIASQAQRINR